MRNTKLRRCLALLCLALLLMAGCGMAPASATPAPAASPARMSSSPPTELPEAGRSFSVHFIDVGQADAALVECDGHYMLIDGGNRGDSDVIYTVAPWLPFWVELAIGAVFSVGAMVSLHDRGERPATFS